MSLIYATDQWLKNIDESLLMGIVNIDLRKHLTPLTMIYFYRNYLDLE